MVKYPSRSPTYWTRSPSPRESPSAADAQSTLRSPALCTCAKLLSLCLTLCDPTDCSPPGSSAIGCSRQEYCSGLPFPPSGDLPWPRHRTESLLSPATAGGFFTAWATWEAPALCKQCFFPGVYDQVYLALLGCTSIQKFSLPFPLCYQYIQIICFQRLDI